MSQYPVELDEFTNPTPTDPLGSPGPKKHSSQHSDINDAVEALEAKVGIDDSDDPTSLDARLTDVETAIETLEIDQGYTHDQAIPSAIWTINHDLGYVPGGISIVDSAGSLVIGEITYITAVTVTVAFQSAFAGKAYLS